MDSRGFAKDAAYVGVAILISVRDRCTHEFRRRRGHRHVLDDHRGPETAALSDDRAKRTDDEQHHGYAAAVDGKPKTNSTLYNNDTTTV